MYSRTDSELQSIVPFVTTASSEKKSKVLNTRAIKLFDYFDLFGLEAADKFLTNITTNVYIFKASGKIKEGNETLKGDAQEYSGFLGLLNVLGVNFLVLVKEVFMHFAVDDSHKIFEIYSIEFRELCEENTPSKLTKDV